MEYNVFILLLLAAVLISSQPLRDFQEQCQLHCPLQNRTEGIHLDVGCGPECKLEQCLRGCQLWSKALQASCQAVCNGTQDLLPPKELYCVMGCNDALSRYLQQLKESLGGVRAPELVADSVTSRSLMLEWEEPGSGGLGWALQWRYEAPPTSWAFAPHLEWAPNHTVLVHHLTPYTKYRFRVAVVVAGLAEAVVSEASLVMGTLAEGRPSSKPTLVRAAPADPTRVSVSWAPGPFPNGPVLSYVLSIDQLPSGYKAHKDIPALENKQFYMFQNLSPSKNYSVSVAMRNAVGLGPPATIIVTTPPASEVKGTEKTVLVLAGQHTVTSQAADMLDDPIVLYKTQDYIRGVGVDVRGGSLFISDSEGQVLHVGGGSSIRVLEPQEARPHALSVDWLNRLLYVLARTPTGHWQVSRCRMDGSALTVAIAGLPTKPLHIEVDPYNGYLWWVMEKRGLYRLDLADISNGVRHEVAPELILASPELGAFTVDHTNFRVLVPDHSQNTVLAVSLDGGEVVDIRVKTQRPQFRRVVSMAMAGGLFYWTDGLRILTEEYHPGQDAFFHNLAYPAHSDPAFVAVRALVLSSQPVPLPVNPPTALQAVMGPNVARASWAPPHLLGGQGKGAWQNWSYQLSIESEGSKREMKGMNTTWFMITGLTPGTQYVLRVAAYTSSGVGPWSAPFVAETLTGSGARAAIVWSTPEGLLRSDPTGHTVHTLINKDTFKDGEERQHVTDIAWYRDLLFLVTNSSSVYWYNDTSQSRGRLRDIDTVASIAIDWIGRKLYWSNPKQQLITRGNLNGSQQEPLPILTVARELNIDAVNGYIYWSTGHAVECAHLNGKMRRVYYPAELFSGKQVMGLTLDMHGKSLYWIVRSHEGSSLLRAPLAQDLPPATQITPTKMSTLQYPDMQGSLCYFDQRLLWLRDDHNAVIGDMTGKNSAVLSGMSLTGLYMVTVLDESLHFLPEGLSSEDVNVIPEAISNSSLRVVGNFSVFNITWMPVQMVNYGQVFYELKIRHTDRKDIVVETTEAWWRYNEELAPYSSLVVSVRALTYWGGSSQTTTILHSPPSSPSQPTNPRLYLLHSHHPLHSDNGVVGLFRWDTPLSPNGIITSYSVTCWTESASEPSPCSPTQLPGTSYEYIAHYLPPNSTVFFQVRGCTEVGCGVGSAVVRGESNIEAPVPKLLAASSTNLILADLDSGRNISLAHPGQITALGYSSHDRRVFWLDDNSQIVTTKLPTNEKNKLVSLNSTGMSMVVDWVGRTIFWSERGDQEGSSLLKSYDINQGDPGTIRTVIVRPATILSLQIDPLNNKLYWVERKENGFSTIMRSHIDGTNLQEYFGYSSRRKREACDCPESPLVAPLVFLDHKAEGDPRLLWVDSSTESLISSDLDACFCQVLVDGTQYPTVGFPPTSLTAGLDMIYWSNETEGKLYSMSKTQEQVPRSVSMPQVSSISAFGAHLQPFPEVKCLVPGRPSGGVELVERTSDSITVRLPNVTRPSDCINPLAKPYYTLYYAPALPEQTSPCAITLQNCSTLTTYGKTLKVEGLEPFTSYVFLTSSRNHYSDLAGIVAKQSLPSIFYTAAGAPSAPEGVEVVSISPSSAVVRWEGEAAFYQVLWKSGSSQGQHSMTNATNATLSNLLPNHTYDIWVKAYSLSTDSYSESDVVNITMFPEPNNITLLKAAPYSLNISWQNYNKISSLKHEMQLTDASGVWSHVPLHSTYLRKEIYFMEKLYPKTFYTFRLKITYTDEAESYYWPPDNRFTFRTLGDRPSPPGPPITQHLRGEVYQVIWEPSRDNGATVEMYWLEGKVIEEVERTKRGANFSAPVLQNSVPNNEWTLYYNGTDNYWIITELNPKDKYQFRVRARNSYGWSEWSSESGYFELSTTAHLADKQDITLLLCVLTPAALLLTGAVFFCIFYHHEKEEKGVTIVGDVELATLRELPWRGEFVESSNALYEQPLVVGSLRAPRLRRDQITLTRFLGSGAFGEVFEGKARDSSGETRVAIKTLRKGASEQEKGEFLKEAQLMSNFRHPHILQLLGVCLDNDPSFIIMELMEGGDLLTYLRSSRPVMSVETSLSVVDLVGMSVDVARGCCYLEEMHFVHRDLACRNCLVSSTEPSSRLVKIGDFGLARDIYKNDYYRKEGEGLLPVRWMAPESLVDGVFTSQSDVWAFGVLIWEIMSLGQQPYPARTNLEVLHYVRNGGRLGQPINTSPQMYELMMKCWRFNPEERPTFRYCLDVLEELKLTTTNEPLQGSLATSVERRMKDRGSECGNIPKYLELMYEEEEEGSGYEVPRCLEGGECQDEVTSLDKLLPTTTTTTTSTTGGGGGGCIYTNMAPIETVTAQETS